MSRLSRLVLSLNALVLLSACQTLKLNDQTDAAPAATPALAPAASTQPQPAQTASAQAQPHVFFFLAQRQAADHLQRVALADNEAVYILPQPILTRQDLSKLQILENKEAQTLLLFTLNPEGGKRLAEASTQYVGRYLAMIVNGTLLALPTIAAPLTDNVLGVPFPDRQKAEEVVQAILGSTAQK